MDGCSRFSKKSAATRGCFMSNFGLMREGKRAEPNSLCALGREFQGSMLLTGSWNNCCRHFFGVRRQGK